MEKDAALLGRIDPDRLQARADLVGDCLRRVGLDDPAIAAQQVEEQPIRDDAAIGETPAFDPARLGTELPTEFGEKPRLADARLADYSDHLGVAAFDLLEKAA